MSRRTTLVSLCLVVLAGAGCEKRPPFAFEKPVTPPGGEKTTHDLYLEMVKRGVTDALYAGEPTVGGTPGIGPEERRGLFQGSARAVTLLGFDSLDNIRFTIEDALARGVPGDLIEAGAWRGGATIYMRAVLEANGVHDRKVWVADSFEGFPEPTAAVDAGFTGPATQVMVAPIDQVKTAFERFGFGNDPQVEFLQGWFADTLPAAPIERLAILRVDADLYQSTMDALVPLYPKLSPGGYAIIDDYHLLPPCRQAVDEYRAKNGITEEIHPAGWGAVYWRKGG